MAQLARVIASPFFAGDLNHRIATPSCLATSIEFLLRFFSNTVSFFPLLTTAEHCEFFAATNLNLLLETQT